VDNHIDRLANGGVVIHQTQPITVVEARRKPQAAANDAVCHRVAFLKLRFQTMKLNYEKPLFILIKLLFSDH
jgi:hypothetical protein